MNAMNRGLFVLITVNLILSGATLYFAVQPRAEIGSRPTPESSSLPLGLGAVPIDGLSLRFRHPELFESKHDMARPAALGELVRRGALRTGLTEQDAAFLLGDAENSTADDSRTWHYGLPGGTLVLEFSPERRLVRAFHNHDGDTARSEPLF
jgi:hypothetical protein